MAEPVYRYATIDDLSELAQFLYDEFGVELKKEWGDHITLSLERATEWLRDMLTRSSSVVLLATDGDRLAGALGLTDVMFPWSSNDSRFVDEFLIVGKDYRESKIGARLIAWAIDVAKNNGKMLALAQMTGTDVERKTKWFQRQGLKWMGGLFVRFPERGAA